MKLLTFSVFWLAGTVAALRWDVPPTALVLCVVAAVLLGAFLRSLRLPFAVPSALMLLLAVGGLRVAIFDVDESELTRFHGAGQVRIEGIVTDDPERARSATRFHLAVTGLSQDGGELDVRGTVLVTARANEAIAQARERPYFRYGDRLTLTGRLAAPPEITGFDYPAYLAQQGIGTVMSFPSVVLEGSGHGNGFYRWLYSVRRSMADAIGRSVPEPQASLGHAMLLGIRDGLPDNLEDSFQKTGTAHLLAISGLHVAVVLGISMTVGQAVFGRRRQLYLIAPLTAVWLYVLLAGAPPSAIRAAVMGTVYLAAMALGRPRSVLPALGFAAAVMVAVDPRVIGSVSFQLSFAAMAGIALWAEPLTAALKGNRAEAAQPGAWPTWPLDLMAGTAAMTIATTAATLPLVAFYFERVSLLGLPTTLVTLPVLPVVLITHGLTATVGLISDAAATSIGWIAWLVSSYMIGVVEMLSRLPSAALTTERLAPWLVLAYYGALLVAHMSLRNRIRRRGRLLRPPTVPRLPRLTFHTAGWLVLLSVSVLGALVWIAALSRPDGRLRVAFLDVGQGDAVLITTPLGGQVLVDGGPDPERLLELLGHRMPFRDRTIEIVVLTHADADHLTGLTEALRRYDVPLILERRIERQGGEYAAWQRAVEEEGARQVRAVQGQTITLGGGAYMQVLGPPARLLKGTSSDGNNGSVVLRLVYGEVSILLSGDVFIEAERAMLDAGMPLASDLLKVPHHGSRTSSSLPFLEAVSPQVVIISVGEDNRHGHPHTEALERLERHLPADRVLLTSERGTIEAVTDGKRLTVWIDR